MRCTTIGGSWSCSHTDSYLPLASGGVYGTKVAIVPYLRGVTIAACAVLLSMSVALHLGVLAAVLLSVSVAKHFAACAVMLLVSVALHLGVLAAVLLSVSVAKHFAACAVLLSVSVALHLGVLAAVLCVSAA